MNEFERLKQERDEKMDQLIEDCKNHGIIFNFYQNGKLKTGIIRKGKYKDGLFTNGFVPNYRKLTRKERRTL